MVVQADDIQSNVAIHGRYICRVASIPRLRLSNEEAAAEADCCRGPSEHGFEHG